MIAVLKKIKKHKYEYNNLLKIEKIIENARDFKELREKYGVNIRDEKHDYSILEDIFKYLRIVDPKLLYKEDNHIFYKSKNDKPELLALWLERCYRVVQEQELSEYKKENIDYLVNFIREEAKNYRFDKDRLINEFNRKGIFLAIEPDLKGAKIRGAFKVLNNKPAIYLTPKYKRCADIYFALLHELAHCKSDFNRAKNGSIVSLEEGKSTSDYEIKADKTAFNWMVNDKRYENIKLNGQFDDSEEVPSFVVYRLANDKYIKYNSKEYQEYNKIIV